MILTPKQRQHLKGLAHPLHPVVQVGKGGLTEAVDAQLDQALTDHELLKVKVGKECPETPAEVGRRAEAQLRCTLVQTIGRTLVLYRRHPKKPKVRLSPA